MKTKRDEKRKNTDLQRKKQKSAQTTATDGAFLSQRPISHRVLISDDTMIGNVTSSPDPGGDI